MSDSLDVAVSVNGAVLSITLSDKGERPFGVDVLLDGMKYGNLRSVLATLDREVARRADGKTS